MRVKEQLDLVDEMDWENCNKVEKLDLEAAGLEEPNELDTSFKASIFAYLDWFYDGCESEFDTY